MGFSIEFKLVGKEKASFRFNVSAGLYSYDGQFQADIKNDKQHLKLPGDDVYKMKIKGEQYADKVLAGSVLRVYAMYDLSDGSDTGFMEKTIALKAPPPEIELPDRMFVGKPMKLKLKFKNRFLTKLTNGYFQLSAVGVVQNKKLPAKDTELKPGDETYLEIEHTPKKEGKTHLVVSFNADQQQGMNCYKNVKVKHH